MNARTVTPGPEVIGRQGASQAVEYRDERCTWCGSHRSDPGHRLAKCAAEKSRLDSKFPPPPRKCVGCKHVLGGCDPCTGFEPSDGMIKLVAKILRSTEASAKGWDRVAVDADALAIARGQLTYAAMGSSLTKRYRVAIARGFCTRQTAERLARAFNCPLETFVIGQVSAL